MYYFETIAAIGLKIGLVIQIMSKWIIMSIKGQDHYLTLATGLSEFKIKTCFSGKLLSHLEPNFIWKLMGEWEWKFIQMSRVTWPRWPPRPYLVNTLKNILLQNQKVLPRLTKLWPWIDPDLFYAKVSFGHIGFCIGKSENYVLFWNCCSHSPQSCFKYLNEWVNEL